MTPFKCIFALLILFQTSLTIAAPRYHPEAARLYDAGLRALAHGDQEKAKTALEQAVTLDVIVSGCTLRLGFDL